MSDGPHERRRGVTRGYVGGLIVATVLVAIALVVAIWGAIVLFTKVEPIVTEGVWILAGEFIVLLALALLSWGLWLQALVLLRGRRTPPWAHVLVLAFGGYFVWCMVGVLFGLGIDETWISPFALALGIVWGVCSLLFWIVLARRVYTDRPVPKWPWERRGDDEPDWKTPEDPGGDR